MTLGLQHGPPQRVRDRLASRPVAVAVGSVVVAVAVLAATSDSGLHSEPLAPLILPLVVVSIVYGRRGGTAAGLVITALACGWWLRHGRPDGLAWPLSRSAACLLVGGLVGWFADSRHELVRALTHYKEHSPDLIATADFNGRFLDVNPAFTRVLGYSRETLLSTPLIELVHPDDREATIAARGRQRDDGEEIVSFQNRYRALDGGYRWLEWSSTPDPRSRTLSAVARDITDRKRLEERERLYHARLERDVARRTRELDDARRETAQRLARAAEYRDDATGKHTARVGEMAGLLAVALGLDEQTIADIREAAPLHDVGKVGVADSVLLKRGGLTSEELDHVQQHAAIGAAILSGSSSDVLRMAEVIACYHHEWWDGTGYPFGLRGETIPLPARIVAVADVFDALTHARPYKATVPVEGAVAEIHRLAGHQFDPAVIEAFDTLDHHRLAGVAAGPLRARSVASIEPGTDARPGRPAS